MASDTSVLPPLEPDLASEQPTTLDREPPGSRRFDTLRAYGPRILVVGAVAAIAGLVAMLMLLGRSTNETDQVASSARSLASSVNTDCATGQVVNSDTCRQAAAVADDPTIVEAAPSDPTVSPVTVDEVLDIVNGALADARRADPGAPLDQPAVTAEVARQLAAARIAADDAQVRQIVASALAGQQRALTEEEVRGIVASALADQPEPVPGPQGEQGPAGEPGPPGPTGPAGAAGNPPSGWTFTDSTGRAYTCTRSNSDDATPRYACSGEGGTGAPTGAEPTPETTPEEPTRDDPPN